MSCRIFLENVMCLDGSLIVRLVPALPATNCRMHREKEVIDWVQVQNGPPIAINRTTYLRKNRLDSVSLDLSLLPFPPPRHLQLNAFLGTDKPNIIRAFLAAFLFTYLPQIISSSQLGGHSILQGRIFPRLVPASPDKRHPWTVRMRSRDNLKMLAVGVW